MNIGHLRGCHTDAVFVPSGVAVTASECQPPGPHRDGLNWTRGCPSRGEGRRALDPGGLRTRGIVEEWPLRSAAFAGGRPSVRGPLTFQARRRSGVGITSSGALEPVTSSLLEVSPLRVRRHSRPARAKISMNPSLAWVGKTQPDP